MLSANPFTVALRGALLTVALLPSLALAQQATSASFDQIQQAFNSWLSVQEIYPKSHVPALRQQFDQKVKSLSGPELQAWLDGMDAKLRLLASPQAQSARQWLSYFASPSVVLPERQLQSFDIINMTPEQVQQALDDIDSRRQGRASRSQAFDATRERQVAQARRQQEQRLQFERQEQASRTMASSFQTGAGQGSSQGFAPFSPYATQQRQRPTLAKGPTMYVSPWGGVGFILNQ